MSDFGHPTRTMHHPTHPTPSMSHPSQAVPGVLSHCPGHNQAPTDAPQSPFPTAFEEHLNTDSITLPYSCNLSVLSKSVVWRLTAAVACPPSCCLSPHADLPAGLVTDLHLSLSIGSSPVVLPAYPVTTFYSSTSPVIDEDLCLAEISTDLRRILQQNSKRRHLSYISCRGGG
jgi:hypothetical protein